jgi:tRNA/tmRNA/rRNA uracil-C5-methylase (TrmA/RlmC/RlmD family)
VVDAIFEHPRLVAVYDALDADRRDLDAYVGIAHEAGARTVLDVGCGTGVFALILAEQRIEVTGVDPAGGSLRWRGPSRAPSGCAGCTVTRRRCRHCRSTSRR